MHLYPPYSTHKTYRSFTCLSAPFLFFEMVCIYECPPHCNSWINNSLSCLLHVFGVMSSSTHMFRRERRVNIHQVLSHSGKGTCQQCSIASKILQQSFIKCLVMVFIGGYLEYSQYIPFTSILQQRISNMPFLNMYKYIGKTIIRWVIPEAKDFTCNLIKISKNALHAVYNCEYRVSKLLCM